MRRQEIQGRCRLNDIQEIIITIQNKQRSVFQFSKHTSGPPPSDVPLRHVPCATALSHQTWFLLSFASHKTHKLCIQLKHLCSWTLIEHSCDEPRRAKKAVLVQLSLKDTATVTPFACWHQLSPLSAELFCCQHSPAIRVYNQSEVSLQLYYNPFVVHSNKNEQESWYAYISHRRTLKYSGNNRGVSSLNTLTPQGRKV